MSRSEHATKKYCCTSRSSLPALALVVRVKNFRDRLADGLLAHRFDVSAAIERREIEVLRRLRSPEPQQIDGLGAISRNRNVMRHAEDRLRVRPSAAA